MKHDRAESGRKIYFCKVRILNKVFCSWKRKNGVTTYKIVIPANTTAKVVLSSGEKTLTAGEYEYTAG